MASLGALRSLEHEIFVWLGADISPIGRRFVFDIGAESRLAVVPVNRWFENKSLMKRRQSIELGVFLLLIVLEIFAWQQLGWT